MLASGKRKKKGKDTKKKNKKVGGGKENGTEQIDSTRKREHTPIVQEKAKNMGKVRRMNRNAKDKKGDIENEKETNRKENFAFISILSHAG